MKKLAAYGIRLGAICGTAALCTGCPNPNTYGTPRTTPAGKIQHSVAAEGFGFSAKDAQTGTEGSGALPNFPTYTLRVGLADSVDIGARVANLTSIGTDVKWNFLKSDSFDMAIDPGLQFFHVGTTTSNGNGMLVDSSVNVLYIHAPLMFGINVSDSVSIVPTMGVTYGWSSTSIDTTDAQDSATGGVGLMLRPGIGFDFRISPRFAIHPEITFLKTLNADNEDSVLLYVFGIGFNFGNLPQYGGSGGGEK
jgi:hypothetical protein